MALTKEFVKLKAVIVLALALASFSVEGEAKKFLGFGLLSSQPGSTPAAADGGSTEGAASGSGTVFDVTKYGAKPDGKADSTMSFQRTWAAACKASGAVKMVIPAGTFLTGETIFAGPCTASPITIELQGTMLSKTDVSLYAQNRWISVEHVSNVIFTGTGTLNGQGDASWKLKDNNFGGGSMLPDSLVFMGANNSTLENINMLNPKGFHMKIVGTTGFTARKLTITAPGESPNTDGMHISGSSQVNITDCKIGTGDDCISIGEGNTDITITKIECGPGHGISVGSLGKRVGEKNVKGITVTNCTFTKTTNGARIKTYGQSPALEASSITFDDIIMNDVQNPIIIDQNYASKSKNGGSKVKVSDVHFKNIRGTSTTPVAVALQCSNVVPCERVELVDIDLKLSGSGTISSACQNAKATFSGKQNPSACAA